MTNNTRRLVWLLSVLVLVASPLAFVALEQLLPTPADRNRSWLANMSDAEVRVSIGQINSLPVARQKLVFKKMSATEKAAFWQARIAHELADPTLTTDQRAALKQIAQLATPSFYEHPADYRELGRTATSVLRKELGPARYDELMGDAPEARGRVAAILGLPLEWARTHLVVSADAHCTCIDAQWYPCPFTSLVCDMSAMCRPLDECQIGIWSSAPCSGLCGAPGAQ